MVAERRRRFLCRYSDHFDMTLLSILLFFPFIQEQKKLRHQARMAREAERQELVRQGLLEPPKNKVKISNFMRVMGADAVQDPTALEKQVRNEQQEREGAHADRNLARKLTPAERREKKNKKLFEDMTLETIVSLYR